MRESERVRQSEALQWHIIYEGEVWMCARVSKCVCAWKTEDIDTKSLKESIDGARKE